MSALRQHHGRKQLPRPGAVRESSGRLNSAQIEAGGDGIHQSAPAQALRRNIAQHAAFNSLILQLYLRDRAGRGAHSHRNARTLKGRPGRRGGAQQTLAIPHHDLTVGAQIHQPVQVLALVQARGENPRQNIAAHKPTQARQKAYPRPASPSPITDVQRLQAKLLRLERVPRKGLNIQPAKQMMHDRIAHHHDIPNLRFRHPRGKYQLRDQAPHLRANQIAELILSLLLEREANPAHHIGAKPRLPIERGGHRQHARGREVQQLGGEGGSSQIDRHTVAGPRREVKGRVIHQNRCVPLAQLDHQIILKRTLTGQSPTVRKFVRTQALALRGIDFHASIENANPAAAAPPLPAARELNALGEQQITQRRAPRSRQLHLHGLEGDSVCGLVRHYRCQVPGVRCQAATGSSRSLFVGLDSIPQTLRSL